MDDAGEEQVVVKSLGCVVFSILIRVTYRTGAVRMTLPVWGDSTGCT